MIFLKSCNTLEMTLAKAVNTLQEEWQEQREMFGFV